MERKPRGKNPPPLSAPWVSEDALSSFWKFSKMLFHLLLEIAINSNRKFWLNGKRPCFPGRNVPNGISCSITASLIPFSGLRGRFAVDGTDFYNLYDSGMKLTSPEFFLSICPNRELTRFPIGAFHSTKTSGLNFRQLPEQHFPKFPKRGQPLEVYPNFSKIFSRKFSFHSTLLPEILYHLPLFPKFRKFLLNGNAPCKC